MEREQELDTPAPIRERSLEEISKKIRFLLQTQGVPYARAAEYLGLTNEHFQDIIDGMEVPSGRIIRGLAELCGVKTEFLTGEREAAARTDETNASPREEGSRAQTTSEARRKAKRPLSLKDLALRFQALVECLVEKELLTAAEIKQKTAEVEERTAQRNETNSPPPPTTRTRR